MKLHVCEHMFIPILVCVQQVCVNSHASDVMIISIK